MKKTMIAIAAMLIFACTALVVTPPPPTPFEQICEKVKEQYDKDCGDLAPPIIIFSQIVPRLNPRFRGVYFNGENYIFIHPDKSEPEITIIHETVHYVINKTGALIYATGRCESEEMARVWTAEITDTVYVDDWRARYQCGSTSPFLGIM